MPCCSTNRSQRSSAITSIRLETERFSKEAICSSLCRCSSRTVRLSFGLFLFFLDFAIRSFLHLVLHSRITQAESNNLYAKNTSAQTLFLTYAIHTYIRWMQCTGQKRVFNDEKSRKAKQLFPQESKARNAIANKDAHNFPQELPMLMGEKLIHSQMKSFRELRPGVSVVGIENGNACQVTLLGATLQSSRFPRVSTCTPRESASVTRGGTAVATTWATKPNQSLLPRTLKTSPVPPE